MRETRASEYLGAAAGGTGLAGRAAELNAALEMPLIGPGGGVAIPWAVLLGPQPAEQRQAEGGAVENRVFTTTAQNDGGTIQRTILARLFGPGVMDALGVRLDSVPVGMSEFPIINAGVVPAQVKESAAAAAPVAATIGSAILRPKKISGAYEYTHELGASLTGIEEALRRDLADAVKSAMSNIVLNGQEPTEANPQHIEGLLTKLTGTDLASAQATAADYGRLHSLAVDGIHAEEEGQVMSVIGDETYRHSAGLYIAGSGESGSELLRRRSGGCMASTYIPAIAGKKQAAVLHAAGPNGGGMMRADSCGAVWPVLELVRDPYTKASRGVVLTWIALWDVSTALRPGAYRQVDIQVQA